MTWLMCKHLRRIGLQLPNILRKVGRHQWNSTSSGIKTLYVNNERAQENCAPLMPFMDFQTIVDERDDLEYSIKHRRLSLSLETTVDLYEKYKDMRRRLKNVEQERDSVSQQLHSLTKKDAPNSDNQIIALKEQGKKLRNDWKNTKNIFHTVEDEFIENYLSLPNILQTECPGGDYERILFRHLQTFTDKSSITGITQHLNYTNYIKFIDNDRYFLMDDAAEFDVNCPQVLAEYFVKKADFLTTANPDFARRVLLEATDPNLVDFHHQIIDDSKNKRESFNEAYLTGGASFESYLGCLAKLSVFPNILPIKWITNGRLYEKTNAKFTNLYSATQNNAVQIFVATSSALEASELMETILNQCVDFYRHFNIHFRIVYSAAANLTKAESLRAQIEIYSPTEQQYICIGRISNYTDYISKRILFNERLNKRYNFPYMVGGPIMYTSRLIAALLEHNLPFKNPREILAQKRSNSLNTFKDLFK